MRHFLGWDSPLTDKVCSYLLDQRGPGPVDLERTLLLVPTRQAGRRLREALALRCSERKTALLSAHVITPGNLLHLESSPEQEASPSIVKAVWANVLLRCPVSRLNGLFSMAPPVRDFSWALHTGNIVQSLRQTLAEAGHRIEDVPRLCGDSLPEPDRWRDLVRLETDYLAAIEKLGVLDPCILSIRDATDRQLPANVERIVVAAVPDPSPLAVLALERFAPDVEIDILVHADESLAEGFDTWGRPLPEYWAARHISIPESDANAVLAGSPVTQAQRVVHEIAVSAADFGPADIAIGVPDRTVAPFVAKALDEQGLPAFDPADRPLREHPLYGLVDRLVALLREPGYAHVSSLLRHPDMLAFLKNEHQCPPATLLTELDDFQNTCLPSHLDEMVSLLTEKDHDWPSMEKSIRFVQSVHGTLVSRGPEPMLRDFLQTVYSGREINTARPEDRDFEQAAACLDEALRELSDACSESLALGHEDALTLFLQRLSEQSYRPEPYDSVLDIEGWLELPWNDAPFLIVTGMNDGAVPGGRLSDIFLPDAMRRRLGIRDDAARLTRDAYLMSSIIESRRGSGRVCFITGKTGQAGDPLKPSRLFFQCSDEELPGLAARLFGAVSEERQQHPSSVSFRLDAAASPAAVHMPPSKLSVTALRDYLACPFRFYLKHALRMEPLSDDKIGLDAMDFGTMVHCILEAMARDPEMRKCEDRSALAAFFSAQADDWIESRFGKQVSLPILVSLDAARQRLAYAARVQTDLVRDGWEIISSELTCEMDLHGILLRGKIDRIDRHRESGQLRVIDYKTSDAGESPAQAHLAAVRPDTPDFASVTVSGKERRWIDLQLPLYLKLLPREKVGDGPVELAYFNLPKAVTQTDMSVWDNFDGDMLEAASTCAVAVIDLIKQRVFWPPAERITRDDFETLFHGAAADSFEKL